MSGPSFPGSAEGGLPGDLPSRPECPFCGERRSELVSTFGSQLSVSTYWCRACRSPFEFMKWGRKAAVGPGDAGEAP